MRIEELYQLLCRFYGLSPDLDIRHFLILADGRAQRIAGEKRTPTRETLLIRQSGDWLEIGLFIDPSIIVALEAPDPLVHLDEFACAAEGASHFLYLIDRAKKDRCVSRLELELQGEVDKFLTIHLIAARLNGSVAPGYFDRLFEEHHFNLQLSPEERHRYEQASYFAAKYCSFLRQRFFNPLRLEELMPKARDFFSRDLTSKLSLLIP